MIRNGLLGEIEKKTDLRFRTGCGQVLHCGGRAVWLPLLCRVWLRRQIRRARIEEAADSVDSFKDSWKK